MRPQREEARHKLPEGLPQPGRNQMTGCGVIREQLRESGAGGGALGGMGVTGQRTSGWMLSLLGMRRKASV